MLNTTSKRNYPKRLPSFLSLHCFENFAVENMNILNVRLQSI